MSRLIREHDPLLVGSAQVTTSAPGLRVAPTRSSPGCDDARSTLATAGSVPATEASAPAPAPVGGGSTAPDTPSVVTDFVAPATASQLAPNGRPPLAAVPDAGAPMPWPGSTADPVESLWLDYLTTRSRDARDLLVLHYLPLVRALGHRTASTLPPHVELSDLLQAGVFGLLDAIERYEPARCARFESYAAQRIRGAMLDELRAQDWVPRTIRGRVRELERAQERLTARLGRAVTDRELAAELGMPVREMRSMVRQVQLLSVEALDEMTAGHGGVSETLVDDARPDPMVVVQARETTRQLAEAVSGLGDRDRIVLYLYYVENHTLAEIGRRLGVTESRVCQLHSRLVGRLRGRLEELAVG